MLEAEVSEESRAKYLDVSKRMDELLQKQEMYWAQRSRISWLKHGDKNMKFFSFQSNTKEEEKSYKWNAKFTRAVGGGFRGGG